MTITTRHETGRIGAEDAYDIDVWQSWLSVHDIVITDVRSIVFFSDDSMTVYQYARDDNGRPFVDTYGNIVMEQPGNVLLESSPPAWINKKQRDYPDNMYL